VAALTGAGLFLTYTTQTAITVNIDGDVIHHRTWAGTVGEALEEAGVQLDPADVVAPALDESLTDGMTITVRRARAVALDADGALQQIRTQSTHPLDVLHERSIALQSHDAVQVDGRTYSLDALDDRPWDIAPTTIRVVRSVSLTVIDNGRAYEIRTTQPDVGGALDAAGIALYRADRVAPDFSTLVTNGMTIRIERSVPVTVQVDGRQLETRARGPLVSDALASISLAPIGLDYTIPDLDDPLVPEMTIEVVRVSEAIVIEREPVPFVTVERLDPDLARGEQRVIDAGSEGLRERRVRVRTENGREVSREIEDETIIQAPVPRVIAVGR
jgi:uncharacterized protein YabE (DUF348 family)